MSPTVANTSTMRLDAPGWPYGVSLMAAIFATSNEQTFDIAMRISSTLIPQSIVDGARGRPCCLEPMLTVGVPTEGASSNPLEELPITASEILIKLRYRLYPNDMIEAARCEFMEQKLFIFSVISYPDESAFTPVKIMVASGKYSNAAIKLAIAAVSIGFKVTG